MASHRILHALTLTLAHWETERHKRTAFSHSNEPFMILSVFFRSVSFCFIYNRSAFSIQHSGDNFLITCVRYYYYCQVFFVVLFILSCDSLRNTHTCARSARFQCIKRWNGDKCAITLHAYVYPEHNQAYKNDETINWTFGNKDESVLFKFRKKRVFYLNINTITILSMFRNWQLTWWTSACVNPCVCVCHLHLPKKNGQNSLAVALNMFEEFRSQL